MTAENRLKTDDKQIYLQGKRKYICFFDAKRWQKLSHCKAEMRKNAEKR